MKIEIWILLSLAALLSFPGCASRRIVIDAPDVRISQDNTWANQTNVEENVDTSDLDKDEPIQRESPASVTEVMPAQKMERVTFPISEYNKLPKSGKGTVKGTIFVKDAYDNKVYGKNTRLYLNPVTSYSKQWYNESYISGYKMEKADSRLFNYLRFTASDSAGNFAFHGVPSGTYYLIGTVKCGSECGYSAPKNIRIATQVSVSGNQVVTRELSRLAD